MHRTKLSEIITTAIDATLDNQRWVDVCEMIDRRYGGTSFLYSFDLREVNNGKTWFSNSAPEGVHALLSEYEVNTPAEEAAANLRLMRGPSHNLMNELEYFGFDNEEDFPDWEWRNSLRRVLGNRSRVGGKLNDVGPWLDVISMHLPHQNSNVPQTIGSDFEVLFPVLAKTVETSRLLRSLIQRYSAILEIFDELNFGAVFLDSQAKVVFSNQIFREVCKKKDAMELNSSQQPVAVLGELNVFQKLVIKANDPVSSPSDLIAVLDKRSGERGLVVRVTQLTVRDLGDMPYTLAFVFDPSNHTRISGSGLAKLGTLTQAESEICQLLVQGLDIAEISDLRETSKETVRTQIKTSNAKLGCRSRLDLLRVAMATSSPLREQDAE